METELRITQSVDSYRVNKMRRLLADANGLHGRLWTRIVQRATPEMKTMLYELSGLNLLTASLGDMLKPGGQQLLMPLDFQLESLAEENTKVSALLAADDVMIRQRAGSDIAEADDSGRPRSKQKSKARR